MKILSRLLNNCRESDRQIGMELEFQEEQSVLESKKWNQGELLRNF